MSNSELEKLTFEEAMQELEKLAEMKEKGLIDDDEFKQMKKEILEK